MAELKQFALLIDGEFKEIRKRDKQPKDITHKNVVWLPYVEEIIDNSNGRETVTTRGDMAIESNRCVRTTTIRDKTEQELTAEKEQRRASEFQQSSRADSLTKALSMAVFELINDTRSNKIPKEKPITLAEFEIYLKGKM